MEHPIPVSISDRLTQLSEAQRALLSERLREDAAGTIAAAPSCQYYPLSRVQFGIWLFEELWPGTSAYNNPAALRLRGKLDVEAIRATFEAIQRRHDVLRSCYPSDDDGPHARVEPELPLPFTAVDMRREPSPQSRRDHAERFAGTPFQLDSGPVWRIMLLRLGEHDHLLVIVMHHIVSDGWSLRVLADELQRGYARALRGEHSILEAANTSYFSLDRERKRRLVDLAPRLASRWRERLAGHPLRVALPYDRAPNSAEPLSGAVDLYINEPITTRLEQFCARDGTSLFVGLVAACAMFLFRCSGQRKLIITTPIACREDPRSHNLIGCFLNTVPLALNIGEDHTLREVLYHSRQAVTFALAHGELPFADIVAASVSDRVATTQPLGNVMLIQNNAPLHGLALEGLSVERHPLPAMAAKQDWAFMLGRAEHGVVGELEFAAHRFSLPLAQSAARGFAQSAEALATEPDRRVGKPTMLVGDESS
jgi:hypothetical protein